MVESERARQRRQKRCRPRQRAAAGGVEGAHRDLVLRGEHDGVELLDPRVSGHGVAVRPDDHLVQAIPVRTHARTHACRITKLQHWYMTLRGRRSTR
eukprot:COSAG01_NODE_2369_length_7814_cov_22.805185_6_plen_97_part_00